MPAGHEAGGKSEGGGGQRSEGRGRRYDEEYVAKYSAVAKGRMEQHGAEQSRGAPPSPQGSKKQGDKDKELPASSGSGKGHGSVSARGSVVQLLPGPKAKGRPRCSADKAATATAPSTGAAEVAAGVAAATPAVHVAGASQAQVAKPGASQTSAATSAQTVPAPRTPPTPPPTKSQRIRELLQEVVREAAQPAPAATASQAGVPVWSPMPMWAVPLSHMGPMWQGAPVASGWAAPNMAPVFFASQPQLVPSGLQRHGQESRGVSLQRQLLLQASASRAAQTPVLGRTQAPAVGTVANPEIRRPAKVPVIHL